jgi:type II secretory pathway pseudopilin PulG
MSRPFPQHSQQSGLRAGFTTVELIIAMVVTLVLLGLSAPMYRSQSGAIKNTSGRMDAARSAAYSSDAIEQDLRNAGVGAFDGQPFLVRVADNALSFNADMVTARDNDPIAVFYDPSADSVAVASLRPTAPITLPNSAQTYPAVGYLSNAETINYFITPDTAPSPISGTTLGALYRKVNTMPAQLVSRSIVLYPSDPIFRYFKRSPSGVLSEVSPAALPQYHSAHRHGAQADTGAGAAIDSIAMVSIKLVTVYANPRGGYSVDTLQRNVRIANQGLLQRAQCGESPLAPGTPTAVTQMLSGRRVVRLQWPASGDELYGERDVEMYAVYRRELGAAVWGEPLANVPGAGVATLSFIDTDVESGTTYQYAVSALDCTPAPSVFTSFVAILVP